ncbi:MAG TPA: hypothetical protein VLB79_06380, partial [Solirubrobacterales bacterium]|nr:hypothetical protein [Solirubrobacterales bacterium]
NAPIAAFHAERHSYSPAPGSPRLCRRSRWFTAGTCNGERSCTGSQHRRAGRTVISGPTGRRCWRRQHWRTGFSWRRRGFTNHGAARPNPN